MTREDISDILAEWPYDPERNVRRVTGPGGVEQLQVRLPLGIEQYEMDGRPDGFQPRGMDSWLEYYRVRLDKLPAGERHLSAEDCRRLHEEGLLYYYRYLLLFQLGDYDRVIRDTVRNLEMLRLIKEHADDEEDSVRIAQYEPYILRMLASARALRVATAEGNFAKACDVLRETRGEIRRLETVHTPTFDFERRRSLEVLESMINEMTRHTAPSETEQLRRRLRAAVEEEDYERAARLRDVLRRMERSESAPPTDG